MHFKALILSVRAFLLCKIFIINYPKSTPDKNDVYYY